MAEWNEMQEDLLKSEGVIKGPTQEDFPKHISQVKAEKVGSMNRSARLKRLLRAQFLGGPQSLPDSFRMSTLMGSIVAYNDLTTNVWYTAMRQTTYGCDYEEFNEKLFLIWTFIQTPWGMVTGWIGDASHHRANYLLAFVVFFTTILHWGAYVVNDEGLLTGIFILFQMSTTQLSVCQFKLLKQRCEVYYGSENLVLQDKEANRLAPLSDISASILELTVYTSMYFLFKQKNSHLTRFFLYVVHSCILMLPLVALKYRSNDLFVQRFHHHSEKASFEEGGLVRRLQRIYHYFIGSVKGILKCKVGMYCLLRNFLFKSAQNIIQYPISLNSANSWQNDETQGADCNGSISNLFLVGLFSQSWYIVGAIVYLFTLSGMVPYRYYRYVFPVLGLCLLGEMILIFFKTNMYINSVLMALVNVSLYFVYEFDMVLGLAAVPEAYFGFYNGLTYFAIGLSQLPYPVFGKLGISDNVPLMISIVMGIIVSTIIISFIFSKSCEEELKHISLDGHGPVDDEEIDTPSPQGGHGEAKEGAVSNDNL